MALAAPLLRRKRIIKVANETTKGTKEAGTVAVFICSSGGENNLVINPAAEFQQRKGAGLYLGHKEPGILGPGSGVSTFSAELRGDGSSGMDSGVSALLQACGFKNTSETYTLHSSFTDQKTLSLDAWEDGIKKGLGGAMGNVVFDGEIGKPIYCDFNFLGRWIAPIDEAMPAFAPGTETPPKLASGTFTLDSESIKIGKFSLNINNVVVMRADVDSGGGIAHYLITDYDPVLSIDPEADTVAGYDFYGKWLAGAEAAVSLVIGSGAGKQITFTIPKLQYRELTEGEREGIQIYDLTGQCNHDSGNDAVSIAVTGA